MKKTVIGILAHVDAGKTTLAEALLYTSGALRRVGRVDHGDTALDTHSLERERGITIFASRASFPLGDGEITLLDTPGHVDFSSETERTLQILDAAILVISATDGIQAHTRTLWRLLSLYRIPVYIFVTKMDFARRSEASLMDELQQEFGAECVDFSDSDTDARAEQIAMLDESLLEAYLAGQPCSDSAIAALIRRRMLVPCFFGSGLRLSGIEEFLDALSLYAAPIDYPAQFGARVYKITYDPQGGRISHLKITGGTLKVRDSIRIGEHEQKIPQIRFYSGAKFKTAEIAESGDVCAIPGLEGTQAGMGLGHEASTTKAALEPVMRFRIVLPEGCDPQLYLPKLKRFEEEDPQLHVQWDAQLSEIMVELMGEVQAEILRSLIMERLGIDVVIDSGRILYKETIAEIVEGVGHYEPLRHYAEVHLLLEPLPRGSGLRFASSCSENALGRNWQRLVLTHLAEKQHVGVLSGAPITDMKITLAAGRAHLKHTEGGDFRQATYRAVRQGLMQAKSVLLEPYAAFRVELPTEQIGRAISDLQQRSATINSPEMLGTMTRITGRAPIAALDGYVWEVASYTGGQGRFSLEVDGYDICHNPDTVLSESHYRAEADRDNTPDSVFCAHGSGFVVPWRDVPQYMHLESVLARRAEEEIPRVRYRNLHIEDKELEAIMEREFGPIRRRSYGTKKVIGETEVRRPTETVARHTTVIVDGYNVIHAWDALRKTAEADLDGARQDLLRLLISYSAFTHYDVILVFDAYNVSGTEERHFVEQNVRVVYTREKETADMYIERLITQIGKNERVRVVTSDGMIQLSAIRVGVLRVTAAEFGTEIDAILSQIGEMIEEMRNTPGTTIGDMLESKQRERDASAAKK